MGHGDASSLLRTSSASERDAAAHAEDQRQRAEAATTAADLELARVQAEVASVRDTTKRNGTVLIILN